MRASLPIVAFAGLLGVLYAAGCGDDATPGADGVADVVDADASPVDTAADSAPLDSAQPEAEVAEGCGEDADCAGVFLDLGQCERAACNMSSGVCVRLAKSDGDLCTDRNACTSGDRCTKGVCESLDVVTCADENPCTTDRCDMIEGCVFEPNTARCDDGSTCTTGDECDNRRCVGKPVDCDDDNPCTEDRCDEAGGCAHTVITGPCSDGDPCTVNEACVEGRCLGEAVPGCEVVEVCGDGACSLGETCESCAVDCAVCCAADEVVDCTGSCIARSKVGNGVCHPSLACAAIGWDAGDCPVTCGAGEVEDCTGRCMDEGLVGDGVCHDGAGDEADFRCLAFGDDGGDCTLCGSTAIVACDDSCVEAARLGDGICDAALDCARWEGDDGDCCGPSEVRGCGAEGVAVCVSAGWLGDGLCDVALNCLEQAFDAGDCTTLDGCGEGGIGDCGGVCRGAALIGDGTCHRGQRPAAGADFFCGVFDFDGGDCPACGAGEVASCDGRCVADGRADGVCDVDLDCDKNDFDGGDCCPAGFRKDCEGDCEEAEWIGDGFCDDDFACLAFSYDGGDCAACEAGEIFDCNGECVPETLLGDGTCEDGRPARPDLNCDFHANDGGDCPACPAGQIPTCNGECVSVTRLGDGTCDVELACAKWAYDRADCCSKDEIRNCEGGCTFVNWISDAYCDEVLDCVALDYDGGDCTGCGPNEVSDCNGVCYPDRPIRRGDAVCDDGSAGLDLNCAHFGWDDGDCRQCPAGQLPECGGATCIADTIGDLTCDVALDCRKYGRDDCCEAGEVANCIGGCSPVRWVGDGVCDAELDCPGRSDDGGDCGP